MNAQASPRAVPPAVRPTPFHVRTAALCHANEWGRWAGYQAVNVYDSVEAEYFAIRNQAGVFDASPMCKYRIAGPDAETYLNHMMTRDVGKLRPGRVAYCVWCDDDGFVVDDGTLFRFASDEFRLCCQEHQNLWLSESALGFDVVIEEVSEAIAALALQGPTACAILARMGLTDIESLRPFDLRDFEIDGLRFAVSRTGFTADLGYELWVTAARALELWDRLFTAGAWHGLRPIGSAALEMARIEAGFIMTGVDFVSVHHALRAATRGRTPFDLSLDWLVDFDKGHFTGRRALLALRGRGPRYRLVGLDIAGNKPAHHAWVYHRKRRQAGVVTSALWSPVCKRNLALAMLKAPFGVARNDDLWVEIYHQKELKWERVMVRARIVERPFFRHPRRTATPPADF